MTVRLTATDTGWIHPSTLVVSFGRPLRGRLFFIEKDGHFEMKARFNDSFEDLDLEEKTKSVDLENGFYGERLSPEQSARIKERALKFFAACYAVEDLDRDKATIVKPAITRCDEERRQHALIRIECYEATPKNGTDQPVRSVWYLIEKDQE